MDLPARYGKYELIERIALGGMAEVFLARSFGLEGFEKRLVIKRILPELARNRRITNLFIQEAKVCAACSRRTGVFRRAWRSWPTCPASRGAWPTWWPPT